jgi:hypothetical protein
MNAASVGWLPLEWRKANDRSRPGGLDFTSQELLEWSVVSVPSLPTALVTARSAGVPLRPLFDWAERLLDAQDFAVIGKSDLETLRKAARMPKAKPAPSRPEPESAPAAPAAPARRDPAALAAALHKRDLYSLGDFGYALAALERLYDRLAAEAGHEDDGSDVPAKFRAWLDDGNRILLEMAGEETAEQIAGTQDETAGPYAWAAELEAALTRALDARGLIRKGAKHSAETVRCLRSIGTHLGHARDELEAMMSEPPQTDEPDGDDEAATRARDERRARALALKARCG